MKLYYGPILHYFEEQGQFHLYLSLHMDQKGSAKLSDIKSSFSVDISYHEDVFQELVVSDFESVAHYKLELTFGYELWTRLVHHLRHLQSEVRLTLVKSTLVRFEELLQLGQAEVPS